MGNNDNTSEDNKDKDSDWSLAYILIPVLIILILIKFLMPVLNQADHSSVNTLEDATSTDYWRERFDIGD